MAKKARKAKKAPKAAGKKKFSMKSTHTKVQSTIDNLKQEKKTKERDELLGKLEAFMAATHCGQDMLIEI
jgi:hypothetical protein